MIGATVKNEPDVDQLASGNETSFTDGSNRLDPVRIRARLDDIPDLNEAEKELMYMWNIHMIHQGYSADNVQLACEAFVDLNGLEIVQKKLYNNFVLHVIDLLHHDVISEKFLSLCVQRLQDLARANNIELPN